MAVQVEPQTGSRPLELAAQTGRAADGLVEDALAGYLPALTDVRETLDTRYDGLKSGRVRRSDGEEALARLRRQGEARLTSGS